MIFNPMYKIHEYLNYKIMRIGIATNHVFIYRNKRKVNQDNSIQINLIISMYQS